MIETHEFIDNNWGRCLSLKNNQVELVIPFEFGPRVLRYGFIGDKNHFAEFPEHKAYPNKENWYSYGGHRLWHAPEDVFRTYQPDNDPVTLEYSNSSVLIRQETEACTQLQKEMEIRLDPEGTHVQVIHRIRNHYLFEVRLAVWAVSVMATRGRAILPLPQRGPHGGKNLKAQTSISLWPYTDLKDTRWQFGQKFISFRQDTSISAPQKIGIAASRGWLAYLNHAQAFVKKCAFFENQTYPDQGSAFEIYADHKCVELESLAPLIALEPGGVTEMVEDWYLLKGFDLNADENNLDQLLSQTIP